MTPRRWIGLGLAVCAVMLAGPGNLWPVGLAMAMIAVGIQF